MPDKIPTRQVRVKTAHQSNYPQPIAFFAGEEVRVGRRDEEFRGWIWTTVAAGNSGWAPEELLDITGPTAVAREDYLARELETVPGERLLVLRELAGWLRVRNAAGSEGWVPAHTVQPAAEN